MSKGTLCRKDADLVHKGCWNEYYSQDSPNLQKALELFGDEEVGDAVLSEEKGREFYRKLKASKFSTHLETFSPKEKKQTDGEKKARRKVSKEKKGTPTKLISDEGLTEVQQELQENPELRAVLVNHDKGVWDNSAKRLHVFSRINRFGKKDERVVANTKHGNRISMRGVKHFGSIGDYYIDGLANSKVPMMKGQDVTFVSDDTLRSRHKKTGTKVIRRMFITNLLKTWCKILRIRYYTVDNDRKGALTGLELFSSKYGEHYNSDGTRLFYVTGRDAISMLKDILFLLRYDGKKDLGKAVADGKVSNEFYTVIRHRQMKTKLEFNVLLRMASRNMWLDHKIYKEDEHGIPEMDEYGHRVILKRWRTPYIQPSYITSLLKELNGTKYFTDMLIPAVRDTKIYPVVCTSMRALHQTEDEDGNVEIDEKLGDYDYNQYTFERA